MELKLQPEEVDVLRRVLESYLSDLRMEIANTDRQAWREPLKHDEAIITTILARLQAQAGEQT